MMPAQIEQLRSIFKESLELEDGVIVDMMEYNTRKWDSVAHMALVAAIEDGFSIMLETDDVLDMSSFSKAVEILDKYAQPA